MEVAGGAVEVEEPQSRGGAAVGGAGAAVVTLERLQVSSVQASKRAWSVRGSRVLC